MYFAHVIDITAHLGGHISKKNRQNRWQLYCKTADRICAKFGNRMWVTKQSTQAFSISAPSTWNSLPEHIRRIDKLSTFTRQQNLVYSSLLYPSSHPVPTPLIRFTISGTL